ncbi:MAG: tRNA 2-thiouridine(34) synthase MnmA [Clostridia bacterium]|nr:tRNA 2-thiouridine(34) synthase MnmA [Clostridia bacterium]
MINKKVLVAMSGGVDSSAAAYLLKEKGYEVAGAIMRLWDKPDTEKSIEDARKVCENLGIDFYVFDNREEFKETVIENFINEYANGRTPNPCVVCNKFLKFGAFLEKSKEMGFDYIATGHYAKIVFDAETKRYNLVKSSLEKKDQSYFLYNMTQEILSHMIFPLADFENKDDVRALAEKAGIQVAKKPDSQEICFIPDNDHTNFILKFLPEIKKGKIIDKEGKVRGEHEGIVKYTIGQRKGLGISNPTPLFVVKLDAHKNEVIVGNEEDLYNKELIAYDFNLIAFDKMPDNFRCTAKIRYAAKPVDCTAIFDYNKKCMKVIFDEPQRAITSGQSVVLYDGNVVIGGGIIQ